MLGTPYYMSPEICKVRGPGTPAEPGGQAAAGRQAHAPRACPRGLRHPERVQ